MSVVEIWTVNVAAHRPFLARHWTLLDEAERERASRFRQTADSERFVIARATLRALLGTALGEPASAVRFLANAFGKPRIDARHCLQFNTSHSGEWVLHALSTSAEVGVDVEAVAGDWAELELLREVLSSAETQWLLALPKQQRPAAFTQIWVRKEAYVKARGEGLSRSVSDICVLPVRQAATSDQPAPHQPAAHQPVPEYPAPPQLASPQLAPQRLIEAGQLVPPDLLSLSPIDIGPGYAGCLAVLGPMPHIRVLPCLAPQSNPLSANDSVEPLPTIT